MNNESKLKRAVKAIAGWWGIFLILGCCAAFAFKIAGDLFTIENYAEDINLLVFIPLLLAGSLLLSILFCSAKALIAVISTRRRSDKNGD